MARRKSKTGSDSRQFNKPPHSPQVSTGAAKSAGLPLIVLALTAFGFYINTVFNGYALDDGIVITENAYTMKGFAGIPSILSTDGFSGLATAGQLTGGRYRPLSIVTFAIEQGLFGTAPALSHLINVILYTLITLLIFVLLYAYLFRGNLPIAFISALTFAIHPVHTEVVANLKSRDELLSLFFVLVSMLLSCRCWKNLRLHANSNFKLVALSVLFFFLALLSKESALTFIAVIPLTSYVFMEPDWRRSLRRCLPFVVAAAGYLLLRFVVVGIPVSQTDEVLNSPFLLATGIEKFATKIAVLGRYLLLLVFPHPLSYDYSYNQIPYAHFSEPRFILSLLVNGALLGAGLVLLKRRSALSYGILLYFITISIASNFVIDIGAPLGERFLFQPSLGFAVAIGYSAHLLLSKHWLNPSTRNAVVTSFLVFIVLLSGYKTITRNRDWKDDFSLFSKDVHSAPNSAKTHAHLAVALLKRSVNTPDGTQRNKEMLQEAVSQTREAIAIYPSYVDAHVSMGLAYAYLGALDDAANAYDMAGTIRRGGNKVLKANLLNLSQLYLQEGARIVAEDREKARYDFERAVHYNPSNSEALFNLGGLFYNAGDIERARQYWQKTLAVDPVHKGAADWLQRTAR